MTTVEWVGVLIGGAGVFAGVVGALFAYLAWRNAQHSNEIAAQSLELNKEQAAMRPELKVRMDFTPKKPDSAGQKSGVLTIKVLNEGRTAAHNVHGWIQFEAERLAPYKPPLPPPDPYGFSGHPAHRLSPSVVNKRSYGTLWENDQEPEDGYYKAQAWEDERLLPGSYRSYEFRLTILKEGVAKIRYRFVSADGAEIKETEIIE